MNSEDRTAREDDGVDVARLGTPAAVDSDQETNNVCNELTEQDMTSVSFQSATAADRWLPVGRARRSYCDCR